MALETHGDVGANPRPPEERPQVQQLVHGRRAARRPDRSARVASPHPAVGAGRRGGDRRPRRPREDPRSHRCASGTSPASTDLAADEGVLGSPVSAESWQALVVEDPQPALVELGGGDPFDGVYRQSLAHQAVHGCGLFPAGPAVMQLASMFLRTARARTIVDLGCGIGYSTFWLAEAAASGATVTGIDSDAEHVELARSACSRLGLDDRVRFIVGDVAEVLRTVGGPVDAVHDDAWFAAAPTHLEAMVGLLRPGGLLTMPNWFLLVDALSGSPRNDWEKFAGPTWAADAIEYAEQLAARRDLVVSWTIRPPVGVAVKVR
jgi:predicted O-methyltransferase YrrM